MWSFCVIAYSTSSPSAPHQTAVLVSATFGCCLGQHPFTSLQPFPLPYIYAGYDCNSWPTNHVCILNQMFVLNVCFFRKKIFVQTVERMDGFMAGFELYLFPFYTCKISDKCGVGIMFSPSSFVYCVFHRAPVVSPRKRKYEEDERQTIPNVLQGEVARLNPKFLVNLDPSHCSNNGTVHLICKLGK